ncbi:MAG: glycosyltransferase family 4 protein [Prevotellaceae bacterium]|nr:glycosyltransferase family 4 protein [Prevotellaceae bacterium]
MRVLMFGWEFPPHITGGLGTACYGLVKGLAKHNIDILFVMPKAYGDEDPNVARIVNAGDIVIPGTTSAIEDLWRRITFMEIGSNLIPYIGEEEFKRITTEQQNFSKETNKHTFYTKFQFSGKYGTDLTEEVTRYALVAATIAKNNQFDVIHAHDWLTYPAGVAAKKISGKPLIVHVHATEFDRSGENVNQNVYDIERRGMEEAVRVITVSNLTRNIVIKRYGINPKKVFTVHNAVDFSNRLVRRYKRSVDEKVVTFLGRVTYQKGPDYFVEAANKVLKKLKNVRFVMAGSGDMLNRVVRRVAQLRISNHFHFTGFLKGEEVNRMFSLSDVYVMPSVSEPFGISPLEAMSSDVPVIISKQSGVAEILSYALKIDFWDVDAMADVIHVLLQYPALSKFFVRNGQEEVNNLKWENAAAKVIDIYNSTM